MATARNELVVTADPASPLLNGNMFGAMWNLAEAMAKAKTVPEHLRGSPGDCLRVVEMAHRCGQSPFALADHCFLTGGKLALDGQAMMALINASPKIEGNLRYEYSGENKARQIKVIGRLRGETEPREVVVTLELGLSDSKGARARWERDPDQMLAYYGARKWARRHAPEVTLGLYTPDELAAGVDGSGTELRDITPPDTTTPAASPQVAVAAANAAAEAARKANEMKQLVKVVDQHGETIATTSHWPEALKKYRELTVNSTDPQQVGINNLGMLKAVRPHVSEKVRPKLEAEIEAIETIMAAPTVDDDGVVEESTYSADASLFGDAAEPVREGAQ